MQQKIDEKIWNSNIENIILKKWNEERIYDFKVSSKNNYVIDTPPPYPSGRPWHIGAAAHYAQIDMIARTARMFGKNVYFPIGIDRNGLPVEIYTEKKHKIKMRQRGIP
jgi:valyl-tRNA synthetase